MSCRRRFAAIVLLGLIGAPGAAGQGAARQRIPAVAQLANGRIVEVSGGGTFMRLRGNTAGLAGSRLTRLDVLTSEMDLDLSRAVGTAYFVDADEEMSLARAWSRMRPGQHIEIAAAEESGTTVRRVGGTPAAVDPRTRPGVPGTGDPLGALVRRTVERTVVSGPIYVWVLGK